MKRLLAIGIFLIINIATLCGQSRITAVVADSANRSPLVGAVIRLHGATDTLTTVTDNKGVFVLNLSSADISNSTLTITSLGYGSAVFRFPIKDTIFISPISFNLSKVTVVGNVPIFTQKGDTTVYNAAAIKVLAGSEAIELVHKMPGLEVTQGGYIKHNNVLITKTFVNSSMLFGSDPRDALRNLPAEEIVKMEVFTIKTQGKKGTRQEKAMNVVTRTKMASQFNVFSLLSYGADTEKNMSGNHRQRYGAGAEINFFTKENKLKSNLTFDNSGRLTNRLNNFITTPLLAGYVRKTDLDLSYERIKNSWGNTIAYKYSDRHTDNRNSTENIYSVGDDLTERRYSQAYRNISNRKNHSIDLNTFKEGDTNFFIFNNFNFKDGKGNSLNNAATYLDGTTENETFNTYKSNSNGFSWNVSAEAEIDLDDAGYLAFTLDGRFEDNNGDAVRIDSLSSTPSATVFSISDRDKNYSAKISGEYNFYLSDEFKALVGYEYELENTKSRRYSVDRANPMDIDAVNSFDFTKKYKINRPAVGLAYWGLFSLNAGLTYEYADQFDKERIPTYEKGTNTFKTFLPYGLFTYNRPSFNSLINYRTSTVLPSTEMTNENLDTSNPLYVRGGNKSLKASTRHNVLLQNTYSLSRLSMTLNLESDLTVIDDPIVIREFYFPNGGTIPQLPDYQFIPTSTFATYANANSSVYLRNSAGIRLPIKFTKSIWGFNILHSYEKEPAYEGERLFEIKKNIIGGSMNFRSNFSKNFDLNFSTTFNRAFASGTDDINADYRNVTFRSTVKYIFIKRCYVHIHYQLSYYKSFNSSVTNNTSNLLNGIAGVNFAKNNACSFSFSVFDILNDSKNFSNRIHSNYISSTWRETAGRYFTFNFSYRLMKSINNRIAIARTLNIRWLMTLNFNSIM